METVTAFIPRDPQACFLAFTDARQLASWVPGLRRADILSKARGLAAEVHFEFASELAYTLVYTYDRARREIRWEPKLGRSDGVSGWVRFEPFEDGTRVTYALAHGDGRGALERELGNLERLVDAYSTWLTTTT